MEALVQVILAVGRFGGLVVALAAGLGVTASLAVGAVGGWASIVALRWLARPAGAVAAVGDTEEIYRRNIRTLRALGHAG